MRVKVHQATIWKAGNIIIIGAILLKRDGIYSRYPNFIVAVKDSYIRICDTAEKVLNTIYQLQAEQYDNNEVNLNLTLECTIVENVLRIL